MIKEHPGKDLGLKIGSKEEALWTNLKEKLEEDIVQSEMEIEINQHVIALAKKKILAEKGKV